MTLHLSTNDSAVDIDGDQVVITITDDDSDNLLLLVSVLTFTTISNGLSVCKTISNI